MERKGWGLFALMTRNFIPIVVLVLLLFNHEGYYRLVFMRALRYLLVWWQEALLGTGGVKKGC